MLYDDQRDIHLVRGYRYNAPLWTPHRKIGVARVKGKERDNARAVIRRVVPRDFVPPDNGSLCINYDIF